MIHLHFYFQPPSQTQHIQHTPTFSWYPSSVPSPYFLLPLNSIVVQVRNLEIILDIFFPFHPENLQSPDDSTFYLLLSSSMLPCILSQSTSPCNAFSHDYYKKPPLYMLSESLVLVPSNSSSRLLPMCGYWNASLRLLLPPFKLLSQFLTLDHQILDLLFRLIFLPCAFSRSDITYLPNAMFSKPPYLYTNSLLLPSPHVYSSKLNSCVASQVNLSFHTSHKPPELLSLLTPDWPGPFLVLV